MKNSLNDTRKMLTDHDFDEIYKRALANGCEAGMKAVPVPMVVRGYEDDPIMDGMCGFAWISCKPGTSKFAKWLVKKGYARPDSYYGGVTIWISQYNQSMARKEAHAHAMAAALTDSFKDEKKPDGSPKMSFYGQSRLD